MKIRKTGEKKEIVKREVSQEKLKIISDLVDNFKKHRTTLVASTKGLPSAHFHEIKKNLRGKAVIKVVKKSAAIRAIDALGKDSLGKLKEVINADVALFFSDMNPFELSSLLADNQSPAKARSGDIAPEDINVEPGPTNLVPGPAISELASVGLKVAVEGGKLAIKLPRTIVKKGEIVKENVASVLAKLDIKPMKVGFEPIAAYDTHDNKVYVGIKIDKQKTLEELKDLIGKALGFAVARGYIAKETISLFIAKAGREEIALTKIINAKSAPAEQTAETKPAETQITEAQQNTTTGGQ